MTSNKTTGLVVLETITYARPDPWKLGGKVFEIHVIQQRDHTYAIRTDEGAKDGPKKVRTVPDLDSMQSVRENIAAWETDLSYEGYTLLETITYSIESHTPPPAPIIETDTLRDELDMITIDPRLVTKTGAEPYTLRLRIHGRYYSHYLEVDGEHRLYEKNAPGQYTKVSDEVTSYFYKWAAERVSTRALNPRKTSKSEQHDKCLQRIYTHGTRHLRKLVE